MDKGKPEVKGAKVKSSKEEKDVEDIFYNKMYQKNDCYLIKKIRDLLFPNRHGSENWEECRKKVTSGNIYKY